jgi:tRNA uridine 5-carbamoylmethylation protein Kti12
MQLIFLYGPPASGKLTVGKELERLSGFRLFHNHLTVQVARTIFEHSHMPHPDSHYTQLLQRLRLDCIQAAADAYVNLIFTLAYSGAMDDDFVKRIVDAVESKQGTVHFVQLTSPDEVLMQRINNVSRQATAKLANPEVLRQILQERDLRASVKYPDILEIDTATVQPAEAAQRIMEQFQISPPA